MELKIEVFDNIFDLIDYLKNNEISYKIGGYYGNIAVIYHIGEYRVSCFSCPHWKDRTKIGNYIKIDKELIYD